MNRIYLTLLSVFVLASFGLARDAELTGIIKKTEKEDSPFKLELDGGGSFYLRGDSLNEIRDGTRVWVTGEIQTKLFDPSKSKPVSPQPKHWQIFLRVDKFRIIDEPFKRVEHIMVTVVGYYSFDDFLQTISKQTGWSVVAPDEIKSENISLHLNCNDIEVEEVLDAVLQLHGFSYRMVGDTLVIELAEKKEPETKQK